MKKIKPYEHHLKEPIGYVRFKMELNAAGEPEDALLLEANPAFEEYMGMPLPEMKVFRKFELLSGCYKDSEEEWLQRYFRVSFYGEHFTEIIYLEALESNFELGVYSPKKGEFVFLFKKILSPPMLNPIYDQIITNMAMAVFLTDADGNIHYVGPGVEKVFSYTLGEVFEFENIDMLLGKGFMHQFNNDTRNTPIAQLLNRELIAQDKFARPIKLLVDVKRIGNGEAGCLIMCKDITESSVNQHKALIINPKNSRGHHGKLLQFA